MRSGDGWALTDSSMEVPTAVRDLLLERLDGLDDVARRVVDLVALTGSGLSYEVLATTGEFGPEVLAQALEHLARTGLVVEEAEGDDLAFRLTHPLYYEVAAGALPAICRRRGHAILATALEQVRPDDVEGLARHYLEGQALDRTRPSRCWPAPAKAPPAAGPMRKRSVSSTLWWCWHARRTGPNSCRRCSKNWPRRGMAPGS